MRLKFDFHTGRYIGNILTQVIMASIMVLFGYAYSRLARTLNELENHKTESTFENHLIGKVLLRDTPPFEVKLQRKRVNFLGRKIVADEPDERKEDSDDESEEDEARHPLIVHDRDPEQNLEALRNPDAYRQNLA